MDKRQTSCPTRDNVLNLVAGEHMMQHEIYEVARIYIEFHELFAEIPDI